MKSAHRAFVLCALLSLLAVVVFTRVNKAHACTAGACCAMSTSKVDAMLNPTVGSDEKYLAPVGAPTNLIFVLDTSASMEEWPLDWPTNYGGRLDGGDIYTDGGWLVPGCNDPIYNTFGYDNSVLYRPVYSALDTPNTNWFDAGMIYNIRGDGPSGTVPSRMIPDIVTSIPWDFSALPNVPAWSTTAAACAALRPAPDAATAALCQSCLASSGYFILRHTVPFPGSARLATGNFLNFYGPKNVASVSALTHLINDTSNVRMAVFSLGAANATIPCWEYDAGFTPIVPHTPFLCMQGAMGPSCASSSPWNSAADLAQRDGLLRALNQNLGGTDSSPVGELMYLASYYMRSTAPDPFTSVLGYGSGQCPSHGGNQCAKFDEVPGTDAGRECFSCSATAMIVLTDGLPTDYVGHAPISLKIPPGILDSGVPGMAEDGGRVWSMVAVAAYLNQADLRPDLPGVQTIQTFPVNFELSGRTVDVMNRMARVGGGKAFTVSTVESLTSAFNSIVAQAQGRASTFASSAGSSLQGGGSNTSAIVPQMFPRSNGANGAGISAVRPWYSLLSRFSLYSEFVTGVDLNGNGNTTDLLLVDRNNAILQTDVTGKLIVPDGGLPGAPFWEASNVLVSDYPTATNLEGRNILTVLDTSGDRRFDSADGMVSFSLAGLQAHPELIDYLAVRGAVDPISGNSVCPTVQAGPVYSVGQLITRLGIVATGSTPLAGITNAASLIPSDHYTFSATPSAPSQTELDNLCAALIIQYTAGQDLAGEDSAGRNTIRQKAALGDIFHSSPVEVLPPINKFICDLGIQNQCVRTLYSQTLGVQATPLATVSLTGSGCPGASSSSGDAYDAYVENNRLRHRVVLVGTNDGMVHAFDNGLGTSTCSGSVETIAFDANKSTGHELWAFIPPDILPRLMDRILSSHPYLMDGDIMVRDIWADTYPSGGTKDTAEYHTVAIIAEGRAGTHYYALEIVPPNDSAVTAAPGAGYDATTAGYHPNFRWMFPQPCTPEASEFGKTLLDLTPKAPPIGPVLIDTVNSTGLSIEGNGTFTGYSRYGQTTMERWVAMLSGGWSPYGGKGRGIYMVDAWDGAINGRKDNLWWKMNYQPPTVSADPQRGPLNSMLFSFVAPVALIDYSAGVNVAPIADGFFDTAVVGDTGGQVWVARMDQPGIVGASGGLATNWFGARAFQTDKATTLVTKRWPFNYLATTALQSDNGYLRAYLGTGDRYDTLDTNAGICRFDNPLACSKYRCATVNVAYGDSKQTGNAQVNSSAPMSWTDGNFNSTYADAGVNVVSNTVAYTCGTAGIPGMVAGFSAYNMDGCPSSSGTANFDGVNSAQVTCRLDADQGYTCNRSGSVNTADLSVLPAGATLAALGNNHFFAPWVFGGSRTFTADGGASSPLGYDAARFTNTDLVDVTATSCTSSACTGNAASNSDKGWQLQYLDDPVSPTIASLTHRTGSGAVLLSGCVLWNGLFPNGSTAGACAVPNPSSAQLFQANYITGAPNCASSFLVAGSYARYIQRSVNAPPPEPAMVAQISAAGQVQYSLVSMEMNNGQPTQANITPPQDLLQSIYELPVNKAVHMCRHRNSSGLCAPQPP